MRDDDALRVRHLEDELGARFAQEEIAAVGGRVRGSIGEGALHPYERALTVTRDVLRLREQRALLDADAREAAMCQRVERAERALLAVDERRMLRALSRTAAEIVDYEPLELIGFNARALAVDYERSDERWAKLREQPEGEWVRGSGAVVRRDGREQRISFDAVRYGTLYLVALEAHGEPGRYVGNTDEHALERALSHPNRSPYAIGARLRETLATLACAA